MPAEEASHDAPSRAFRKHTPDEFAAGDQMLTARRRACVTAERLRRAGQPRALHARISIGASFGWERDAVMVELVQRRLAISREIGAIRAASGGTRLSLAREQQVLARFGDALGADGAALGMMLLRQGRGRL